MTTVAPSTFPVHIHPIEGEDAGDQMRRLFGAIASVDTEEYSLWEHCYNVASVAAELARIFSHGLADQRLVYRAGLLHDCGKIFVPEAIRTASRKLTPEEWELMKEHPASGAALITAEPLHTVRVLVHQHHERWAGDGYPYGIGGDQIHRLARILSVADYFVAFMEPRPYKPAKSAEESIDMCVEFARLGQHEPGLAEGLRRLSRALVARIASGRQRLCTPDSCAAEIDHFLDSL